MKYLTLLFSIFITYSIKAQSLQDTMRWLDLYSERSDSCFKIAAYDCTVSNALLFLKYEPNSNLMHYQTAQAYAQLENPDKALLHLKKAIALFQEYGFSNFSKNIESDTLFIPIHPNTDYQNTLKQLKAEELQMKLADEALIQKSRKNQAEILQKNDRTTFIDSLKLLPAQNAYQQIKQYNNFQLVPDIEGYIRFWYPYQDSIEIPFIVKLPKNYDPQKKYPLVVAMHGAVWAIDDFPEKADSNIFYSTSNHLIEVLDQHEVLALAPYANKELNWLYPHEGFYILPELIRFLKPIFNIDDDAICLTGHSNGAAGAFNYLVKAPSLFGGFYGLNPRPKVYKGGTFLPNAKNRHFYSIATDQDYYFPPDGIQKIQDLAVSLGIEWFTDMYKGFPHWFPYFDEAKPGVEKMLADMMNRKRNPFSNELYWECEQIENGRCDWLEITSLDTLASPAYWHQYHNFPVSPWVSVDDPEQTRDTSIMAFDTARRSGAVQAKFAQNIVTIQSSRVSQIRLYLSPEMIDFQKKLKVIHNEKLIFEEMPKWNPDWMIDNFSKEFDRQAVWVSYIDLDLAEE